MKLHLGCGTKYLEGFLHLDIIEYDHIDHVCEVDNLNFIEDNSVDEIYACHVLEHFKRQNIQAVLNEWFRVLKIEGILRISVPNFEAIVNHYNKFKNTNSLIGLLYGGQTYEYNYHHIIFDFNSLKQILTEIGFIDVNTYDWKSFLPNDYDDYSKAYLPHMDFENGMLMSLNIISKKKDLI